MLRRIEALVARGEKSVFETTLSGLTARRNSSVRSTPATGRSLLTGRTGTPG